MKLSRKGFHNLLVWLSVSKCLRLREVSEECFILTYFFTHSPTLDTNIKQTDKNRTQIRFINYKLTWRQDTRDERTEKSYRKSRAEMWVIITYLRWLIAERKSWNIKIIHITFAAKARHEEWEKPKEEGKKNRIVLVKFSDQVSDKNIALGK